MPSARDRLRDQSCLQAQWFSRVTRHRLRMPKSAVVCLQIPRGGTAINRTHMVKWQNKHIAAAASVLLATAGCHAVPNPAQLDTFRADLLKAFIVSGAEGTSGGGARIAHAHVPVHIQQHSLHRLCMAFAAPDRVQWSGDACLQPASGPKMQTDHPLDQLVTCRCATATHACALGVP